MQNISIREMTIDDYEQMIKLWENTKGIGLSGADSRANISQFVKRNPGLSYVCESSHQIIGTVLCGHDGRRGYLYHLAVDVAFRNRGIGKKLAVNSLEKLHQQNIDKCHLFLYHDNEIAIKFYENTGWEKRNNLLIYSKNI